MAGRLQQKTVNINFPFEVGDVETIELYRYAGAPVSAEKKVVDAEETIKDLYDMFEGLTLELKEVEETTGNRLALLCLVAALQRLRRPSLLTIHTDNRYLQNGYQSISAWKENGWTRTGNQELRNADLWQQVDKLLSGHAVRFKIES